MNKLLLFVINKTETPCHYPQSVREISLSYTSNITILKWNDFPPPTQGSRDYERRDFTPKVEAQISGLELCAEGKKV